MLSLIIKIFIAYWLAAGVVIVAADLRPHQLIHTPALSDALDTSLTMNARSLIATYRAGGCSTPAAESQAVNDGVALTSADGAFLCGDLPVTDLQSLAKQASADNGRISRDYARYQVVAYPVSAGNVAYVLLVKSQYTSVLRLFGSMPGVRTMEISAIVTFFLALLIAVPLRRLRAAATQIADGNLSARVHSGRISRLLSRLYLRDDIDGMMHDFNAMADRLQSLMNTQKLLLRDVSHELRSPLARLAVALELAKEGPSDRLPTHLHRIELESLRLNSLIGHILSFSYIESIRDLHRSAELSLSSLVHELLPDVQYEAEGRACRIVTSVPRDFIVNGDSEMLRHALENIVRNAIRYSPAGGTVEIKVDTRELNGQPGAILYVSDTGPGVPEDKLDLILNPFYRAGDARRSHTNGFGIGLAIADRAAQLHAGQIIARNCAGGGLVVEMSLPLAPSLS